MAFFRYPVSAMIPVVNSDASLNQLYLNFLSALKKAGFEGDIEKSYSTRVAYSTDNSVYQRLPQAVVLPKHMDDVVRLGKMSAQDEYRDVRFSPRGGGTGTNGQSLTDGLIVDTSRHLNKILEINTEERWVRVQTGVVKDQLNAFLKPFGFFFAPDLSTSNRATIGGMINTDASGQGSLVYGKTSDHVLELVSVLADGTVLQSCPAPLSGFNDEAIAPSIRRVAKQVIETAVGKREQILAKFPRLNRFLTGYDLEHVVSDDLTYLDLSRVICGSEGSLAFVTEAKLDITPIPTHKVLINIKYDSFESALRHAPKMVAAQATSVETVDSKVLNLAREDIIWHSVKALIEDVPGKSMLGLNMVEYNSEDKQDIEAKINQLTQWLDDDIDQGANGVIGYQLTWDTSQISKIYAMRKKAVGLLGKSDSSAKPIAFAEDTAVPPENLADFILEFRALLDSKGLQYGMFGHVDAGVLHVRPALDLCDPNQEVLMQEISDDVVALVAKYGGLMWGEHGKGYRSEYGPEFFGSELFNELRKIKAAFDPFNKMNPGKICTPIDSDESLVKVSDMKRGAYDRQIPVSIRESFAPAVNCNGNGLCFNYDTSSPMCPSFKATADRRHSPKGRASMVREWLRLLANEGVDVDILEQKSHGASWWRKWRNRKDKHSDFSTEVMHVMDECLACKACTSQCPVNVDVPGFRARFLHLYYQRYSRPFKDFLVANVEQMAPWLATMPRFVNTMMTLPPVTAILKNTVGYVDTPLLSVPTLKQRLQGRFGFDLNKLENLSDEQKSKTVLLVQDPFTSYYEAELVSDVLNLLEKLGFNPILLPFKPNGKPQHVKGFLAEFAKTAENTSAFLQRVAKSGCAMIGLDASLVLCYRDEYQKVLPQGEQSYRVKVIHEWLVEHMPSIQQAVTQSDPYVLLGHCTEKTALPKSASQWQLIFEKAGLALQTVETGCCGMAGTYGHERAHVAVSEKIYNLSWKDAVASAKPEQIVATGYSCRSQVKRLDGFKPKHPAQALLNHLS